MQLVASEAVELKMKITIKSSYTLKIQLNVSAMLFYNFSKVTNFKILVVYFAVFDGHNGIDVSEHASYELLKHIENSCEHFRDNLVFAIKKGFKRYF